MFPMHDATLPMLLAILAVLVLIAGLVVILMLILRAVSYSQRLRYTAIQQMIEKGVYDPRLLGTHHNLILGWGIALFAIGTAILVGILILDSVGLLILGLIPLFLGIGLIITYELFRKSYASAVKNGAAPSLLHDSERSKGLDEDSSRSERSE